MRIYLLKCIIEESGVEWRINFGEFLLQDNLRNQINICSKTCGPSACKMASHVKVDSIKMDDLN